MLEVHPIVHETFIVSSCSVRGKCWSISSLLTTMPESISETIVLAIRALSAGREDDLAASE
jgi:hypothetical protein